MSRIADRGAITAAYVGIGMAITIVGSFMLIIPIEFVIWLLALPSGLLIGYYANARSNRRSGPWSRLISNGLVAAVATGPHHGRADPAVQGAVLLRGRRLPRLQPRRRGRDRDPAVLPDRGRLRLLAVRGRGPRTGSRGGRRRRRVDLHGLLLERTVPHRGDRVRCSPWWAASAGRCSTGSRDRRPPPASPRRSRRSPEPRAPGSVAPPRAPGSVAPPRAPGSVAPPRVDRAPDGTTDGWATICRPSDATRAVLSHV